MNSHAHDHVPVSPDAPLTFRATMPGGLGASGRFGAPDGAYSRICWLPILGPTAWTLWGQIGHDFDDPTATVASHAPSDLTAALGLGRTARLHKAIGRLDHFGVFTATDDRTWRVPVTALPLPTEYLGLLSPVARRFHHHWTEGGDPRPASVDDPGNDISSDRRDVPWETK